MHYIVEEIEFDFDEFGDGNPEWQLSQEEKDFITNNAIGLWFIESAGEDIEDELIEKITDKTGWCVKSIKYCENRPHPLTSYK